MQTLSSNRHIAGSTQGLPQNQYLKSRRSHIATGRARTMDQIELCLICFINLAPSGLVVADQQILRMFDKGSCAPYFLWNLSHVFQPTSEILYTITALLCRLSVPQCLQTSRNIRANNLWMLENKNKKRKCCTHTRQHLWRQKQSMFQLNDS